MHILFLTHYFPPEVNAPATRTWEHCRQWAAAGHEVTVVTCAPNHPAGKVFPGYRNRWKTIETREGIRVIRVWTWLSANRGFFGRVLNYVSYLVRAVLTAVRLRRVDVVVATSPQFFCGWAGVLCHWIRRWPLVLEIRDIWPESIVTVGVMRRSPVVRLLEWLERRMYAAADSIVTVGSGYRRKLLERGVPAEKITVVYNGVDVEELRTASAVRSRLDRARNALPRHSPLTTHHLPLTTAGAPFVCGYLGTIGLAHGLEVVLEAADRLARRERHDVLFHIVGDGAECQRLQTEATRRGLSNVRFTGLVPKGHVPEFLRSFHASLVHLRGTELFSTVIPSKIFEAMAVGVPVIAGVRGEAADLVLEAGAGVAMTPDDPDSLIAAIDQLAFHPTAFAGGPAFVARRFNRRVLAGRMLCLLQAVADGNTPDGRHDDFVTTAREVPPAAADARWRRAA